MTRDDLHILCTALAFTGLMLRGEKEENQSERIKDFAGLIEAFCLETALDALKEAGEAEYPPASIDLIIDCFKVEMRGKEPITPPADKAALLKLFDRLRERQQQRRDKQIYIDSTIADITDEVLKMLREEIKADEAAA